MLLRYKASEATSKLKMMRRGRFRKATRLNASSFKRPSSSFRWKKNRRYVCLCFSALSRSAKTSYFLIDIVLIEVDFFLCFHCLLFCNEVQNIMLELVLLTLTHRILQCEDMVLKTKEKWETRLQRQAHQHKDAVQKLQQQFRMQVRIFICL